MTTEPLPAGEAVDSSAYGVERGECGGGRGLGDVAPFDGDADGGVRFAQRAERGLESEPRVATGRAEASERLSGTLEAARRI